MRSLARSIAFGAVLCGPAALAPSLDVRYFGVAASLSAADAATSPQAAKLLGDVTEKLVEAQSKEDWEAVIKLARSAGEQPLSEADSARQKKLLAAALSKRGAILGREAIAAGLAQGEDAENHRDKARVGALIDLEEAVQLQVDDADSLLTIARLHALPDGDRERGLEAATEAAKLSGDNADRKGRALIMKALLRENDKERLADLDEAVKVLPDAPEAFRARGTARVSAKDVAGALEDFKKALELDPKDLNSLEIYLQLLVHEKKFDVAIEVVTKAIDAIPRAADALRLQRAKFYAHEKQWKEALADLEKLLGERPKDLLVRLFRAEVYSQQERYEEALEDAKIVRKGAPNSPQAATLESELLRKLKREDEAVAVLEKFVKRHPEDLEMHGALALLYFQTKHYQQAEKQLSDLLDELPGNLLALQIRANTYVMMGKHVDAVHDYKKVLEQKPDDVNALNNLAWMLATSTQEGIRNAKSAIEYSERAAKITEFKQSYILSTVAAAYAESGDFAKALEWLDKADAVCEDPSQKTSLKAERESYDKKRPWREDKPEDKDEKEAKASKAKDADDEPAAAGKPKAERVD